MDLYIYILFTRSTRMVQRELKEQIEYIYSTFSTCSNVLHALRSVFDCGD